MAQNLPAEADKFAESWMWDQPADGRFAALRRGICDTARKDYLSAIKHYKYLLDKQPNNPALMNNLAWAMGQAKDPKAIELAEQAYKLAPEQPTIIDTLGALLVAKGDVDRGLELLQKASSLAPKNPTVKLNLAKALIKAGKAPDARKELEEIISLGEKLPAANEARALLQGLK
jgi:FimV-like protein